MGALARKVQGIRIVKFDVLNEVPIRDSNGRCIECEAGEAGELLAIIDPSKANTQFPGYTSKEATEKKVCALNHLRVCRCSCSSLA